MPREGPPVFRALGNHAQALATLDSIPEPAARAEGLVELASQEAGKHQPGAPLAVELDEEAASRTKRKGGGEPCPPPVIKKVVSRRALKVGCKTSIARCGCQAPEEALDRS